MTSPVSPLLQEAAKVYEAAFEAHDGDSEHCYHAALAALLRWLLTREPTETMVEAAKDLGLRLSGEELDALHRAMNAALLKEVEG